MSPESAPSFRTPGLLLHSTKTPVLHEPEQATKIAKQLRIFVHIDAQEQIPFETEAEIHELGRILLLSVDWRGGALITTPDLQNRFALIFAHHGTAHTLHQEIGIPLIPQRRAVFVSPGRAFSASVAPGFYQRSLYMDNCTLEEHLYLLVGQRPKEALVFEPYIDLERPEGASLHALAGLLTNEVSMPNASPFTLAPLSDAWMSAVLSNTRHNASYLLQRAPQQIASACVRKAEEFMDAHAEQPISMTDIVKACGVSARALRYAFQRERGISPSEFLKQRRLDRIRQHLIAGGSGLGVSEVAKAFGIRALGHFSHEYKKRFGESPSQTLAKGRSRIGAPILSSHEKEE